MWHVSIRGRNEKVHNHESLSKFGQELLGPWGDAKAGEWVQPSIMESDPFVHVRRRLSAREQAIVGPPRDIRGTAEKISRTLRIHKITKIPYHRLEGLN